MTKLFSQNSKIKNSASSNALVVNFGIPAYKSETGLITCPMAGACKIGCYARQGLYAFNNVKNAYETRLAATLKDDWTPFQSELDKWTKKAAKQGKKLVVRWHDSGDFYNITYIKKALRFFESNKTVEFYAYTKMVPVFKKLKLPENFKAIFSLGGKADHLIDKAMDRHSAVFSSIAELKKAGYADTTKNDLNAIGKNPKIGLVYHGFQSRKWITQ